MKISDFNLLYKIEFPDKKIVTGEGNPRPAIVLVGEAPGGEEEAQGRPFVGKAGKNLDEFLQLIELNREDIYITNAVKFRPTKLSDRGTVSNRTPTDAEVAEFLPFLMRELEILSPALTVTLGGTPLRALAGADAVVGREHGRLAERGGRLIYPLYHPASMIYNPSLRDVYRTDVLRLKDILNERGLV